MTDMQSESPVKNILTFEVEDGFHAEYPDIEPTEIKSRIIPILLHLLDLLDNQKARATFFVIGSVASKFPEIVTLLDSRGHEVASHGFSHGDIRNMELGKFHSEAARSKEILDKILGKSTLGYKGACDFLGKDHIDFFRGLAKIGYKYDCSSRAGSFAGKSVEPFPLNFKSGENLILIPQSAVKKLGVTLYFGEKLRLYPAWAVKRAIYGVNRTGFPAMINLKLWELDRHQKRPVNSDYIQYNRYGNLNILEEKLTRLLDIFEFTTCADILGLEDK